MPSKGEKEKMSGGFYGRGRRFGRDPRENKQQNEHRVNFEIGVALVRVVRDEEQLGVMATEQARRIAMDDGLDLVEIVPTAKPPVCRIMDYSRYRYEQNIKKKEAARKQRDAVTQLKEIRLRPNIADHDAEIKVQQAKKFLEEGSKVQFFLQFRGHREMALREQGYKVVKKIIEMLGESASVERQPSMDGRSIICVVAPKQGS